MGNLLVSHPAAVPSTPRSPSVSDFEPFPAFGPARDFLMTHADAPAASCWSYLVAGQMILSDGDSSHGKSLQTHVVSRLTKGKALAGTSGKRASHGKCLSSVPRALA